MESIYKTLANILQLKGDKLSNYKLQLGSYPEKYLEIFLLAFVSKQNLQEKPEVLAKLIAYMSEQRFCKLSTQYFGQVDKIQIICASDNKAHIFDHQSRAFCLYGKAVSVLKRKGRQIQQERNTLSQQIQSAAFQYNQQSLIPLSKNQSHDIDDILLSYSMPDETVDPILLSNEVYTPFVAQPYALILILPICLPKPEYLVNFMKGTLLHVYLDQANLLSKVIFRQIFYKNSILKGIYFIEEGQVQSTGGRIVARGWVTNGKCKSSGYGWKFKPLPFIKSIAKNQHIWKQFVNDLTLNKEYPFKLSYLLGMDQQIQGIQKSDHRTKRNSLKLPRIGNSSFDYAKLIEIQKVKHYDDRINDICQYKYQLFSKKGGGSLNKPINHFSGSYQENQKKILFNKSVSRGNLHNKFTASSENILIMSVLKKLESLTDQSSHEQNRQKKDKIKISPAQIYQKSRVMKKKRYNQ